MGRVAKTSSIGHIFNAIFLFFAKALHLRKILQRVAYHRFEPHCFNRGNISDHHYIPYHICISNARVLTTSVKTSQRVYQILVYWNNLLLSLPAGVLLLHLAVLLLIVLTVFCALFFVLHSN